MWLGCGALGIWIGYGNGGCGGDSSGDSENGKWVRKNDEHVIFIKN